MKTQGLLGRDSIKKIEIYKTYQNRDLNNKDQEEGKAGDILNISELGRKISREYEEFMEKIEDQKILLEIFRENRENLDRENGFDIKLKCFKIYLRIVSGDVVPLKDEQFLKEHEPELFTNALLFRKQKENPKKHKSLVKDKDKDIESASAIGNKVGGGEAEITTGDLLSMDNIEIEE